MAESPKHGTSSLKAPSFSPSDKESKNRLPDNTKALESLKEISASPRILKIRKILAGYPLFLVGGTIRDAFLGKEPTDIDLTTSADPQTVQTLTTTENLNVIPTGIEHGTLTVVIDNENIEITTFRKPGNRLTSNFSETIEEDLSGRDFTINSMAFNIDNFSLIDPYQGAKDLKDKILRCVGVADSRFCEDPLRIMRMIRFGTAAGRSIDDQTLLSAKKNISLLKSVSVERIKKEFSDILISPFASTGLTTLKEINGFETFFPEILPSIGFEQNEFHLHDVFEHTLWVLNRCPQDNLKLRLSAIFHDLGKPHTLTVGEDGRRHFYDHERISTEIADKVLHRLKFSNKEISDVKNIVALHMRPIDCGPAGVRRLMRDLKENFEEWRLFKYADSPPTLGDDDFTSRASKFDALVETELTRLSESTQKRLMLTGDDIKAFGIPEGREIGKILKALEEIVIEDPSQNDYNRLTSIVKELIKTLKN